jgi:DNA repair photolyase
VEENVQKRNPRATPLITSLTSIDFWYWTRYYLDFYQKCPFGCSYCNTQKIDGGKGIRFIPGLPEEKETIGLGLFSDAYHLDHDENDTVTRTLELLYREHYSVNIVTKSTTLVKDLPLLKKFSEKDRIRVTITILTLDDELALKLEGSSPPPSARFEALRVFRKAGIPAGLAITPIIPLVNDKDDLIEQLVLAAKRSDASWVLFSGFNPTSLFLGSSLWKKTAKIYTDERKLKDHYRRVKGHLVHLLLRENLPIRIPRITLNVYDTMYSSRVVSEYLFNISYLYELMDNHIEMLRFRRAGYEIEGLTASLKSIVVGKKLGFVKGINPEIEKTVEEILFANGSTLLSSLYKKLERISSF